MAENILYVFYPTDIRPKKMEKHITKHCPEISITVFGKIKDFEEQTRRIPPDAILSHPPVIKKIRYFSSHIDGFKDGQRQENYVLVSMNKAVDLTDLGSIKIGVLDILGRKPMKVFVSETLGTNVKIVRVTKTEDILNLLFFGLANAIFVSKHSYKKLRAQSKLPLVVTDPGIKMDLITMAIKKDETRQLFLSCFKRLDQQTNALLGVDQWQLK
ncbi:MAG: hypothetical protein QM504_08970 [Pseudomonadota bacterium]